MHRIASNTLRATPRKIRALEFLLLAISVAFHCAGCAVETNQPVPTKPDSNALGDTWDAIYIEGAKVGYAHTKQHAEPAAGGEDLVRIESEMKLSMRPRNILAPRLNRGLRRFMVETGRLSGVWKEVPFFVCDCG